MKRGAAEAANAISQTLNHAARAFMAHRGVWEPICIHGPLASFAHTADDARAYPGVRGDFLDRIAA